MLCYISFQLYKVITLKRSINGLISVIIFKRTTTNICLNIIYLQDNYLGTYVSINKFMTDTQMAAVLTYLCTLCFLFESKWLNLQCTTSQVPYFAVHSQLSGHFRSLCVNISEIKLWRKHRWWKRRNLNSKHIECKHHLKKILILMIKSCFLNA